jgi:transcriptional regulator with XRE-family HTH domain
MSGSNERGRRQEFDSRKYAEWQCAARAKHGWSTRDLAERAGISQPYVVALERARLSQDGKTPVPTVNVVAAIAAALGADPIAVLRKVLRLAPRHVLLVVDGSTLPPIDVIKDETEGSVDLWVCGRPQTAKGQTRSFARDIRLHRESMKDYDPDRISALLDRELNHIVSDVEGKNIGFIFGESAASVGAHAAWNVCVYEAHILRGRRDLEATMEFLFAQHDEHWFAKGSKVHMGDRAQGKILEAVA